MLLLLSERRTAWINIDPLLHLMLFTSLANLFRPEYGRSTGVVFFYGNLTKTFSVWTDLKSSNICFRPPSIDTYRQDSRSVTVCGFDSTPTNVLVLSVLFLSQGHTIDVIDLLLHFYNSIICPRCTCFYIQYIS